MKPAIKFLTGLTAALLTTTAAIQAQTFTWSGNTSANWNQAGNWIRSSDGDDTVTPVAGADIVFYSYANNLTTFMGSQRTVGNLTFNADADQDISVRLTTGVANTTAGNLTFTSAASNLTVESGAEANITIGVSANGNTILAGDLTVGHNGSGTLLLNRPVIETGGNRSITKNGSGTLQLTALNTFSGALNINAGKVLASRATVEDINSASSVNLGNGTLHVQAINASKSYTTPITTLAGSNNTLIYENTSLTTYNMTLGAAGALTMAGNLAIQNISANQSAQNVVVNGRAMTGAGNLSYSSYNNITSINDAYSLGRTQVTGDNSGFSGNFSVLRGVANFTQGTATNSVGTGALILGTTADAFGAGVYFNPGGTVGTKSIENNIIVRSGGFRSLRSVGDFTFQYNGTITLEGDLNVDMAMTTTGTRNVQLRGDISGVGGLDITRSGALGDYVLVAGNNTYQGGTTINGNSELRVSSASGNGIPDTSNVILTAAGSELRTQTAETIGSLASTGVFGNLVLTNRLTTGANNNSTTWSGTSSGASGITKVGNGTFTLASTGNYTGFTRIVAGSIKIDSPLAVQNSTVDMNAEDSGSLTFGTVTEATLGGLSGSRNISLVNETPAAVSLTVGGNNQTTAYSGNLIGGGSLTKGGTGTLTVSGNNTYAGPTTVNAGALVILSKNSLPGWNIPGAYSVAPTAAMSFGSAFDSTDIATILGTGNLGDNPNLGIDTTDGNNPAPAPRSPSSAQARCSSAMKPAATTEPPPSKAVCWMSPCWPTAAAPAPSATPPTRRPT
jgi:fibronectin-binding autotransporter adhesin